MNKKKYMLKCFPCNYELNFNPKLHPNCFNFQETMLSLINNLPVPKCPKCGETLTHLTTIVNPQFSD